MFEVVAFYLFAAFTLACFAMSVFSKNVLYAMTSLAGGMIFAAPIASANLEARYPIVETMGNIEMIGILLFTKYLVVFELAAVMLLVAMVGAIVLVHKDMDKGVSDDNA